MPRKAFLVQVEINIQAITCPGVWLCPKGMVFLQVQMLGSNVQTHPAPPTFPITIGERFIFSRTYFDVGRLGALQKLLNKEMLYIEMVQWQSCDDDGIILATFQTSLAQLLFPETRKSSTRNAEIDLLMEPMCTFPGILAPKIEVSTKTTIQDKVYNAHEEEDVREKNKPCSVTFITAIKNCPQTKCATMRQRPVCHTKVCHHKAKTCCNRVQRPSFAVRKVDTDLICCKECRDQSKERRDETPRSPRKVSNERSESPRRVCYKDLRVPATTSKVVRCTSNQDHHAENCVVCSKYKHYFESKALKSQPQNESNTICSCAPSFFEESTDDTAQLCNYPPQLETQCATMARKLHARIAKSLTCCADNGDTPRCNCDAVPENIGQFYKKHMYLCGANK